MDASKRLCSFVKATTHLWILSNFRTQIFGNYSVWVFFSYVLFRRAQMVFFDVKKNFEDILHPFFFSPTRGTFIALFSKTFNFSKNEGNFFGIWHKVIFRSDIFTIPPPSILVHSSMFFSSF